MTEPLFRTDAYRTEAVGMVVAHTPEGGVVLDASVFYPTGGGQPGDSGRIDWSGGGMTVATTVKGQGAQIALVPAAPQSLPPIGCQVQQTLDWPRRLRLMRMHTALHLLSVVIPLPVTGGMIGETRSRLDFEMPDMSVDRETFEAHLGEMVDRDLPVTDGYITHAELDQQPSLVKTLSAPPPRNAGKIRLVRIGEGTDQVDLQPCGGTHVARTSEVGALRLGKIESKGRMNRRVYLHLDD
ncbi:alanyl-tRNA editing protein [Roseovarius sp. LXJ103]|uniref:alanyl-tRNA editing protein n=1 Tax=Roseovarius carneus TaxID=2853164 RepID=UPI000D60C7C1|nr:alanyl-tRNA editing protein [Roseovarius carneus]MBZ8119767.1 alanyl-tRNA editing protein [Roseovarius carneus]PWE34630.1 Ala-tRNA(Pro) hydrolase [Pelagicola sp. LXJ1103]